uniref:Uncharacterized protein n=1 Tax=Neogobius melanostomus TaxID=47308 RepID=A0A8C6SHB3_9GOBI
MNSTGSVWNSPGCNSSSSSQFVPTDVFTEAKGGSAQPGTSCPEHKQTPSPGQCFLTHSNHVNATSADRECDASTSTASPGDLAFAQKCADLQRFIRPLLQLLHGLKSGRFDKGLTSFQQSVAIDRLQRILGILQKPDMGEKYLQNLLQIEVMLKTWFPHSAKTDQTVTTKLSQHWGQNQLHIPVKKRKMIWTDPDCLGAVSVKHKHLKQEKHAICYAVTTTEAVSTCRSECDKQHVHKARTNRRYEPSCANGHEFIGITSSCKEDKAMHCGVSPPSPATQDNCVSSSTTTEDSP